MYKCAYENVLVQAGWDGYRANLEKELLESLNGRFTVLAGQNQFEESVVTRVARYGGGVTNVYLFRRSLLVQSGVLTKSILCKNLVLEMNPRILTNWLIIIFRRVLGKNTNLWGHFGGRTGMNPLRNKIRKLLCSFGGGYIIAYTDAEKEIFIRNWGNQKVLVATNSMYFEKDISATKNANPRDFIYCGRMSQDKYPDLVLRSFATAKKHMDVGVKLHMIGDGPLLLRLRKLAQNLQLQDSVIFHGYVSDLKVLKEIYANSIASISYGFVGLQCVQSLGFGTPIIYPAKPRRFTHAPEAYLLNGSNSVAFDEKENLLSNVILEVFQKSIFWSNKSQEISSSIRSRHNIENMAKTFLQIFEN